jgi:hypothetical protein
LPLPLSRDDAEMMVHLCLDGRTFRPMGVTAEMFIQHHLISPN